MFSKLTTISLLSSLILVVNAVGHAFNSDLVRGTIPVTMSVIVAVFYLVRSVFAGELFVLFKKFFSVQTDASDFNFYVFFAYSLSGVCLFSSYGYHSVYMIDLIFISMVVPIVYIRSRCLRMLRTGPKYKDR